MPIDPPRQRQLFQWLSNKGVRDDCPACGAAGAWSAGDVIAPPAAPGGGGTVVGGPSFPLVQVICRHCAHVLHFAVPRVLPSQDAPAQSGEGARA